MACTSRRRRALELLLASCSLMLDIANCRFISAKFANRYKTAPAFCWAPHSHKMGGVMTFSHSLSGTNIPPESVEMADADVAIGQLLERAQIVRETLLGEKVPSYILDPSQLEYSSSRYNMETETSMRYGSRKMSVQRGFCNWLIPQLIMIGQYPGSTPESNGPSVRECQLHIQNMVQDANVSMFCCLQTEVPSQDDDIGWKGGEVYLEPAYRREFPRPFTRYGPLAQSYTDSQLTFHHNPIEDLSVPTCNDALLSLLSRILQHLEGGNAGAVYLHCWGGRGRAGLIGSCLASLLFPELSPREILDWVQRGYDSRLGAKSMRQGLRRSPQTEQQRWFVREFVQTVQAEKDKMR
ncbi:hypothetical protein ACHAWF_004317 [Thalassiosira exigua]